MALPFGPGLWAALRQGLLLSLLLRALVGCLLGSAVQQGFSLSGIQLSTAKSSLC